ncbi:MAG: argininosuccinate lyase [Planctomycetes bacterium]|nr:argininosuccinate lyase [Planctomycetota bacterium]
MALWGGRFEDGSGGPDALFRAFNDSLPFDKRLLEDDIAGSIAWAAAIRSAGVITEAERATLEEALRAVAVEVRANPALIDRATDEDVHSFVERLLVERVGALGKKLHTGRSRNDQVATDLRLWTSRTIESALLPALREARAALLRLAERELASVLPGYTHLQRAQPVLWGHWALAYAEMLERDGVRLVRAVEAARVSPLGSGALAGTAYAVDREAIAQDLGFRSASRNSLDAVSDRDFVVETVNACVLCALHLSRLAEDLIVYSSGEFAFVEMSDRWASGSSLMPQKKNPDALELIRAKAGRIIGAQATLNTVLKGLPLAYNKDLQEDKEPLFEATDSLLLVLRVLPGVLDGMRVSAQACRRAAEGGHANATDMADYLVEKGLPFREAHDVAGRVVRLALSKGVPIERLALTDIRGLAPQAGEDLFPRLALDAIIAKRDVPGGTAVNRVREALEVAKGRAI